MHRFRDTGGPDVSEPRPCIVILAGPNGAGKSTAAPALLQGALAVTEFVNADVIARGLSAFDPNSVAIAAGRVMSVREISHCECEIVFQPSVMATRSAVTAPGGAESGYQKNKYVANLRLTN